MTILTTIGIILFVIAVGAMIIGKMEDSGTSMDAGVILMLLGVLSFAVDVAHMAKMI